MKYKLSLVAISLLAISLGAKTIDDCTGADNVFCTGVNELSDGQTITRAVKVSGTHNLGSLNLENIPNGVGFEFNSSNSTINVLNATNSNVSNWYSRLNVGNGIFANSAYDVTAGNTNFTNLTLKDNSSYSNSFGNNNKITNLTVENGAIVNAKAGKLYIDNILETNNFQANITAGQLIVVNVQASSTSSTQPIFNVKGDAHYGDLYFVDGGVINKVTVNETGGRFNAINTTLNNVTANISGGTTKIENTKANATGFDVKGGSLNITNNSILTDTNINTTTGTTNIENATLNKGVITANGGDGQYVKLDGNVVMNGTEITRTNSSRHGSHNIIVNDNANVSLVDTKLSNLSINAYGINNKVNRLNIKGGSLTNTSIGTVVSNKRYLGMSHLVLDGVNVDNSAISTTSPNIISEYLDIKNVDGMTNNIKANIYVEKDLLIENSTIDITSNIMSGETIANKSTINGKITADTLHSNGSIFSGDINAGEIRSIGSTFKEDIITGDIFDNGSTFNLTVNAVNINSVGSTFSNTVDALVLNANNSNFKDVNINCTETADFKCSSVLNGSNVGGTLTLNNDAKLLLDKGSSVTNLTLSTQNNYVAINGDSKVTGAISNEGVIEVFKGTVSNNITGKGDLITHGATYAGDVNLSDVIGSGSTFDKTVTANNSIKVDNGTFNGVVKVEDTTNKNATLYAYQGNTFKADVTADNAILSYDATKDVSKGKKITIDTSLTTNNALTIKDLTVTAKALKSDNANISNATISSKLINKDANADIKVYQSGALSGVYTITNSDITGGVRVDELNISGSQIKSQVAVNTLNATNNTFYVFGGGLDTSFYDHYSGAIIVRKGAVGSGNTIQLSNTNLGLLTKGYVPIAIVKDEAVANASTTPPANGGANGSSGGASPITSIANPSKVAGGGIGKDFFKVAYKTKIADYELADQFLTYQEKDGRYVWSVGVAGNNMVDVASVDNIVDGIDATNIANGSKETTKVDYTKIIVDIGDMFNFKGFDQTAVESAKFIVASPEYLARTKLDIPYNRYKVFKSNHKDNGIWMNNKNGYNKYTSSSIHHTDINIGADKVTEISNSSLMLGLAINLSSSNTKGNVISDATSKGIGIYAMNKFDNNAFVGLETFYHNIDTTYEAKSLGVNTSKHHNVYTASVIAGQRFGEKVYVEPSLKYDMITYKPSKINGEGISIEGDRQIIHTLGVNVEVGTNVANQLDAYAALGYAKELTDKEDLYIKDEVRPHTVKGEKGDDSIRANLGLNYNISPKATLNADFGYNKYSNQGKEYKTNVGFAYRF